MIVHEHHQKDEDIAAAESWLVQRAKDIDGDMNLVSWKDRIISNVVACAVKTRKKKEKAE